MLRTSEKYLVPEISPKRKREQRLGWAGFVMILLLALGLGYTSVIPVQAGNGGTQADGSGNSHNTGVNSHGYDNPNAPPFHNPSGADRCSCAKPTSRHAAEHNKGGLDARQ